MDYVVILMIFIDFLEYMLKYSNMLESTSPEIPPTRSEVKFDVHKLIEVEPAIETVTRQAIADVWEKNMKEPVSVDLTFASHITVPLDNGTTESVNSIFSPEGDKILIAIDTIKERHPADLLGFLVVLHAAHEARHLVQEKMGDPGPHSGSTMENGTYLEDRHEHEAWQSAIDTFSDFYPESPFTFSVGSNTYSTHH
jgi:hypothetical protein